MPVPAAVRLLDALAREWEPSGPVAARARVHPKAAGQMLAGLFRRGLVERRHGPEGRWEYRRSGVSLSDG